MSYFYPSTNRLRLLLAPLLGLALAAQAQQDYNTGTILNQGSLYRSASFLNASGGQVTSTGSTAVIYYAGSTFTNNGNYTAATAATDQFVGPGGAAGLQTLAGTTAPSFYNLTLANGSTAAFTLSNPAGANVANALTLSNGITGTTGPTVPTASPTNVAGAIRLASTATVVGSFSSTRYIDGYVAKAGTNGFTYPLGATNPSDNTGNTTTAGASIYSPITLSSPGGTTIRYVAGNTPNHTSFATQSSGLQLITVSAREYYPIGTIGAASNSTITIPYNNFGASPAGTPYVDDPSRLTIAAYDGTNWTNLSNVASNNVNTTAKTVTVTLSAALGTGYTALALASTSAANPLPVQLTSFTAQASGSNAVLAWTTASELNNDHFEVERSLDGIAFHKIGRVAGQGSKVSSTTYAFTDAGSGAGIAAGQPVYYRLRQVDVAGTSTYSPVRSVSFAGASSLALVALYPNPVSTVTGLDLSSLPAAQTYQVTLLDAAGRQLGQFTLAGGQVQTLNLTGLSAGTYVVLVAGQLTGGGPVLHQMLRLVKN